MNKFNCPNCKAVLNPVNRVILSAEKEDGSFGLLLLNPEIGDYTITHHENFNINKGDIFKLYCPACHVGLSNYTPQEQLAGIALTDENKHKSAIVISSIAGEHCTYKVVEGEITKYGKDADNYHFDFESLIAWL